MKLRFLKSKKFYRMSIFAIVVSFIFFGIHQWKNKKSDLSTIPAEIESESSKLESDERFASQWAHHNIKSDPISDSTSQKLLGIENKKSANEDKKIDQESASNQTNSSLQKSTSIVTENGTEITTNVDSNKATLAKSVFQNYTHESDGKIKDTQVSMRVALVNTENEYDKNLAQNQENKDSFDSHSSDFNANTGVKNLNSGKAIVKNRTKNELLLAANTGSLVQLKGRDTSIGGAGYQIKAGMRVLAFLPDKLIVTSAASQSTSLYVIGPMDKFTFPQGYVITATAKLNATVDRIEIDSDFCSSSENTNKSVACIGTIKGVDGTTGLSGEIYNMSMWSAIASFATASLAAIPLSQITQTSNQFGVMQSVSVSNSINSALAAGIQSIGQSIQKGFDKSGTQITIPQGSVVQILFTKDTIL
jgi:hypothetical protein